MTSYFGKLKKENGKLTHIKSSDKKLYDDYINSIPEGAQVEFYSEVQSTDGSLAQLAKVHAMIKQLAEHTGYAVSEMKMLAKERAGMCYTSSNGVFVCKSFAESSKEELNSVILCLQIIGQEVNYPIV